MQVKEFDVYTGPITPTGFKDFETFTPFDGKVTIHRMVTSEGFLVLEHPECVSTISVPVRRLKSRKKRIREKFVKDPRNWKDKQIETIYRRGHNLLVSPRLYDTLKSLI